MLIDPPPISNPMLWMYYIEPPSPMKPYLFPSVINVNSIPIMYDSTRQYVVNIYSDQDVWMYIIDHGSDDQTEIGMNLELSDYIIQWLPRSIYEYDNHEWDYNRREFRDEIEDMRSDILYQWSNLTIIRESIEERTNRHHRTLTIEPKWPINKRI